MNNFFKDLLRLSWSVLALPSGVAESVPFVVSCSCKKRNILSLQPSELSVDISTLDAIMINGKKKKLAKMQGPTGYS